MKRILMVAIAAIVLFVPSVTAEAGGGKISFSYSVRFGFQPYASTYWYTDWRGWSNPGLSIQLTPSFRYIAGDGGTIYQFVREGVGSTFNGDPSHVYSPNGFQIRVPNAKSSFVGMYWNGYVCRNGPELHVGKVAPKEVKFVVRNTTTDDLFLTSDAGKTWTPLAPGEFWTNTFKRDVGEISLNTRDTASHDYQCGRIFWGQQASEIDQKLFGLGPFRK